MEDLKKPSLAEELAAHPALKELECSHVERLARCTRALEFDDGELIFRQGENAGFFYLITHGEISLTHAGLHGKKLVQNLAAGDALGWSWLFPPHAWKFNAMAVRRTRVLKAEAGFIRKLIKQDPSFGCGIMTCVAGLLAERLQQTRRALFKLEADL